MDDIRVLVQTRLSQLRNISTGSGTGKSDSACSGHLRAVCPWMMITVIIIMMMIIIISNNFTQSSCDPSETETSF